MKVQVTQKHINKGAGRHCELCPVALALWEKTGIAWAVSNTYFAPRAGAPPYGFGPRLKLPLGAQLWIDLFDRGWGSSLEPTEFELPVPESVSYETWGSGNYWVGLLEGYLRSQWPREVQP